MVPRDFNILKKKKFNVRTHPLLTVPTAITQRDNYQVPLGRLGCWRCSWDSKARKTSGRMLGSQEGCWGHGGLEVPERLNPTGQGWNRSLPKARGASSLPTLCSLPWHQVPSPCSLLSMVLARAVPMLSLAATPYPLLPSAKS